MSDNYNMLATGLKFNSLKEIKTFLNMSVTAQANEYVNAVKNDIVIIGKEQETYYDNLEQRLWQWPLNRNECR
jgi:hypothetical protein